MGFVTPGLKGLSVPGQALLGSCAHAAEPPGGGSRHLPGLAPALGCTLGMGISLGAQPAAGVSPGHPALCPRDTRPAHQRLQQR